MADYQGLILDDTTPIVLLRGTALDVGLLILDGGTPTRIYYKPTVVGTITSTTGTVPASAFFVMSDPPE